jgi:hypothetical protein
MKFCIPIGYGRSEISLKIVKFPEMREYNMLTAFDLCRYVLMATLRL